VSLAILCGAAHANAAITEAARLSAIYDTILSARFDAASDQITRACPPAPRESCLVLQAAVLWWRVMIDPDSKALDDQLRRSAATAIAASEQWTRREPRRAEAWFYLAAAYGPQLQLRTLRGERVTAAREGNRVRGYLEKTLALDPQLHDAYFGIGMYHYYADVMPAAAKFLRMLLFLPGGNREQGLREMRQARDRGVLVSGEADFQLHWLYVWYEQAPATAIELLRGLDARYPTNPVFLQRIAEISRDDLHDHQASAATWQALLARARAGAVERAPLAEVRARIGLARERIELSQAQLAAEDLAAIAAEHPRAPYSAGAIAYFYLGVAYERIGKHESAHDAFTRAIALAPDDDPAHVRARSREHLTRR